VEEDEEEMLVYLCQYLWSIYIVIDYSDPQIDNISTQRNAVFLKPDMEGGDECKFLHTEDLGVCTYNDAVIHTSEYIRGLCIDAELIDQEFSDEFNRSFVFSRKANNPNHYLRKCRPGRSLCKKDLSDEQLTAIIDPYAYFLACQVREKLCKDRSCDMLEFEPLRN